MVSYIKRYFGGRGERLFRRHSHLSRAGHVVPARIVQVLDRLGRAQTPVRRKQSLRHNCILKNSTSSLRIPELRSPTRTLTFSAADQNATFEMRATETKSEQPCQSRFAPLTRQMVAATDEIEISHQAPLVTASPRCSAQAQIALNAISSLGLASTKFKYCAMVLLKTFEYSRHFRKALRKGGGIWWLALSLRGNSETVVLRFASTPLDSVFQQFH